MEPGDLIITPSFQWHDHGNEGTKNVIWMDGLNIPFFKLCPIDFTDVYEEEFGKATHESKVVSDEEASEMKFPWRKTQAQLDASIDDHAIFKYELPGGKSVSTIIAASAEKIAGGTCTIMRQDTANRIYQVHSGSGKLIAISPRRDQTYELFWGKNDAFVVPSWHSFVIYADEGEPLYLFTFSDKAMQDNLGLYRAKSWPEIS
jgi:gentisate 1,2-dioxygenase